jgi:hypothetical protein
MSTFQLIASLVLITPVLCFAQQTDPFTPDSLTRGLWHFDETSGSTVLDASEAGNNGIASGTTIVTGRFGYARAFNGYSDYIAFPSNKAFDVDTSSFQIDLWFMAPNQLPGNGALIRRGLAPEPGYWLAMSGGQIVGQIGNRGDSHWPDTIITVRSDSSFGDNQWHQVTMVRNRAVRKLFLYVDGKLATKPSDDPFTLSLNSDRPLTIGRWENDNLPQFFNGVVDEVRLSTPKFGLPAVVIRVQPELLNFGIVRTGSTDTLLLHISNTGAWDSLRVSSVTSSNPRFSVPGNPMAIAVGSSITLPVCFTPDSTEKDTGLISIASNDSLVPVFNIQVLGKGYTLKKEPVIDNVSVVPNTYYQLRVQWFRSVYDSSAAVDPVTEYSIWRSVQGVAPSASKNRSAPYTLSGLGVTDAPWEFITTVPAMQFEEYSCLVPGLVDYTVTGSPNILMVAARTKDLQIFVSRSDTVNLFSGYIIGPEGVETGAAVHEYMLSQNYPNPFNPVTNIQFSIVNRQLTIVKVFDVLGREVATLVNEVKEPGAYTVQFNGSNLASGVYFYRLQAGNFVQTKKLLLVR